MEREAITKDELIAIYNVCKKRLTISLEDFLNNPKFEHIKNTTVKRYNSLNQFIYEIKNTEKIEILKNNIFVEFGKDNLTEENIYAYYVDRIQELLNVYGEVELNKLYSYCLKSKKSRNLEIKTGKLINIDKKRVKLNGLYDYLLNDTGIDKDRFLKLNDDYYEFERELILTLDSNIDHIRENVLKLNDRLRKKFIEAVEKKYHLVEVNGYYVCRYLFDNFRMIKLLNKNVGYKRLSPNNYIDIFKCSLNVGNVTLAYNYVKKDKTKEIKKAYLELKDNENFKEMVNYPKDNFGITFTIIRLLGEKLKEVNDLNKYLGFMNKITLSKYVLLTEEEKKKLLREAVLYRKKKILKGTKETAVQHIVNISLFNDLKIEDKKYVIENYKLFIEMIYDLSYDACMYLDYKLVDSLINYVSNKVMQIVMVESQDKTIKINKLDFVLGKEEFNSCINSYNSNINNQSLDESKSYRFEKENFSNDLIDFNKKQVNNNLKKWKEQLLFQYNEKYVDKSYEFYRALYDFLAIYERKTGKQYDPNRCLFSFEDVYNFYQLSDEERITFEKELIIDEKF